MLAQPQLVVRFMTVKSRRELNRAVGMGGLFILITTGVAYVVGSLSNVWFVRDSGQIAIEAAGGNADGIIPLYISKALPAWFGVLFMVTLLSAAMSTLSGQFHAMGTAMSRDFYQQLRPSRTGRDNTVKLTRWAIFVGICIVMWLGWVLPQNIIARATAIFFGLCASAFLPMYALGLFWRGVTPAGARTGLVFGFLGSLFYLLFIHAKEAEALGICQALTGRPCLAAFPWSVIDPIMVVFPLTFVLTVVVSLMTRPSPAEHLERCFRR